MQRYYNFTIRTKLFRAFFKNIFPGKRKRLTDSAQRTEKKHAPRTPAAPGRRDCDKGAEEHGKYIILYIGGNGKGLQQGNFSLIGALRVFQSV